MRTVLCTLILNEMEWLPKLYEQHRRWPNLEAWIFVESADRVYAEVNPHLVSKDGLSTDGTSEFLQHLTEKDERVTYVPFGFSSHSDPAQGKCQSRTQYLLAAEQYEPEMLVVLDADEFYTYEHQRQIEFVVRNYQEKDAFVFRHRDVWRPPSIQEQPLFQYEVTGGFWDIPYCRVWRWKPGLQYLTNHNTPENRDGLLDQRMERLENNSRAPQCIHMAFATSVERRRAKHQYYAQRGESRDCKRSWYVESRAAYETWQPGQRLPRGARVVPFRGQIPECFREE